MRLAFFQRDIDVLHRLVPFASGAAAAILSVVPLHLPGSAVATPALTMVAIYYWTIHRPDLLPPSGVFALGLLLDALDGTRLLGVSSLTLLAARTLVMAMRDWLAGQAFTTVWACFLGIAGAGATLQWLLVSGVIGRLLAPHSFLLRALTTAIVFPLAAYVLAQLQRALPTRPT